MEDLSLLPMEQVEAELCSYAARLNGGMCRWLLLVAEFDRREGAGSWGMVSTSAWLAWRTALDARTAREHVRVARALRDLPAVTASFAAGELSFAKVRALTRVATPSVEGELLSVARHATCDELDRIVSAYRKSGGDTAALYERRHLTSSYDEEGGYHLRALIPPEEGGVIDAAIEAAVVELRREEEQASGSAEPPRVTVAQRRADALTLIARQFLSAAGSVDDDDRYLVMVTAEADASEGHVVGGPSLPGDTLRRLACSEPRALLIHDREGNPLWMGRKVRHANRAQRRALVRRDGGSCLFPGCHVTSRLVPHHSEEWAADQGPTDVDVLVLLCRFHHRCVHEGGFRVRRDAAQGTRFRFLRPDGSEVLHLPATRPDHVLPLPVVGAAAPAPGDRLPFDLDLTVTALVGLFERSAAESPSAS